MNWKSASVRLLSRLLRPGASAGGVAAFLSLLLKTAGPRRSVASKNLSFVLPGASPREISRLVNETYEHLVWVGIEFITLQRDPRQALDWVESENAGTLDELSRGAILLTGHVGNWELTAAWLAQSGYNVTAIVQESSDSRERGLIGNMRARAGVKCMPKTESMTGAVSLLKRGEFLGILPDQHGGSSGVTVPFFGIDTPTSHGPAVFAYLTGRPIVPIFSRRISPFRHKIRIAPPIEWEKLKTRDETILDVTRKVNAAVESMILEAPGQWLAQHRRFKGHY